MLSGQIQHQDSIGTDQLITPGSVNWMTAGKGVSHTERTPAHMRGGQTHLMHGYQIWVALPKHLEEMDPEFHHIPQEDLPGWTVNDAEFTLIAGTGFDRQSPVPVHSELFMVEVKTKGAFDLDIAENLVGEIGICIVDGAIDACEHHLDKGHMLVSKVDNQCKVHIRENSHILLFGGKPFPEERNIYWNFVSSSKERLEEAKKAWRENKFPKVAGDDTYVPMP